MEKPDKELLRKEFDRYRNSIFTTESSAPVMNEFMWFYGKIEHVWNTYVVPLQERLNLEKESNHLLHGAMVSAESRGAKKGREEMESENKALRDWKESALAVFAEWDRVSDYIKPRCRLGDKYSARALELFKMIDAENKSLREEINALNGDIQSYRNGHEANAKRYNDLLIERNKLGEEVERLKAEVLKEKFPEN